MPEVKLAFVVGVPHPVRGQDVTAVLVPWAGGSIDAQEVRKRLRQEVSSYKVPRHVLVVGDADIPWLPSQKLDRRRLTALASGWAAEALRQ
jgi:acyl-CoA synthetase (AMP-forming)/AMP-acid ligase II